MEHTDLRLLDSVPNCRPEQIDPLYCVQKMDAGFEHIYLVDAEGRYTGQAIAKSQFRFLWEQDSRCLEHVPGIPYADEEEELFCRANALFAAHPGKHELPVVREGKIVSAVAKAGSQTHEEMHWERLQSVPEEFQDLAETLVLSSLGSANLRGFYRQFSHKIPLAVLDSGNMKEVLASGAQGKSKLVFEEDIFPECPKASIFGIWETFYANEIHRIAALTVFSSEWASVCMRDRLSLSRFVQWFDLGYDTVSLVDGNGNFFGAVPKHSFRQAFTDDKLTYLSQLAMEHEADSEKAKRRFAETSYKTGMEEIPVLKDGKIVALGRKCPVMDGAHQLKSVDFPKLHWNLISDRVAMEYFQGKKRILISSDMGDLSGFRERFQGMLDISVYEDALWDRCKGGWYDLLVCGSMVWPPTGTDQQLARGIYANMLAQEVREYLEQNGVGYYFVSMSLQLKIKNHGKRVRSFQSPGAVKMIFSEVYGDYAIPADVSMGEAFRITGGRRWTVGNPRAYANTIYVFGPCTALGAFAADGETIESFLQQHLNDARLPYRVVNCGGDGGWTPVNNDLNYLYALMDMNYRPGDIVVHFGHVLWLGAFRLPPEKFIAYDEIFNAPPNDEAKCFRSDFNINHIDAEGNCIVAEALFQRLEQHSLRRKAIVRPFFERLERKPSEGSDLAGYLSRLSRERVDGKTIGAIVMNCNPFTLGHRHLVEFAREQVDFLYVFVVEEDQSEFRFQDRLAMAKLNCRGHGDVRVLPSGKYMISSLTFSEYFQKDAMQGQSVFPAKDVRIFGRAIAPCLGIAKRFVGQEPLDSVTQQYNEAMKDILQEYGVEVVEIPRLCLPTGEFISATKVRSLLRNGQVEECRSYLTEESFRYIAAMKLDESLRWKQAAPAGKKEQPPTDGGRFPGAGRQPSA